MPDLPALDLVIGGSGIQLFSRFPIKDFGNDNIGNGCINGDKLKNEVQAVTKLYDIILWLMPQVEKFPRDYKFTLGERIVKNLLDALENMIEASYSKDKRPMLRTSILYFEKLRYLTRLAKDLQCLSVKKYAYITNEIDELGRMTGGWLKAQSGKDL